MKCYLPNQITTGIFASGLASVGGSFLRWPPGSSPPNGHAWCKTLCYSVGWTKWLDPNKENMVNVKNVTFGSRLQKTVPSILFACPDEARCLVKRAIWQRTEVNRP